VETHDQCQEREWQALYEALSVLLAKHGRQYANGDGDFWIVGENNGSSQHKVCVTRVSFLTRPLALAVQRLLRIHSLAWEVLFYLDKPELRPTQKDLGILVRKHDIQEHWNAARMQQAFGSEFRWRPPRAAN
jgi:hypothetical protein